MNHQINIGFETAVEDEAEVAALIRTCALRVLESEGVPFCAEIDVTVVNADTVREMNAAYRDKDAVTDVLSFPLGENGHYDIHPQTGAKQLGDIVISIERAMVQAEQYGHSLQREMGNLTVHSMLHLLGYDHVDGGLEAVRMREKEEAVMTSVGLPRGESYVMTDDR